MTLQDIINWFGSNPMIILSYFAVIIVLSLIGLLLVSRRNFKSPVNYFYGVLVYAVTIPGLLSLILILYSFFFLKTNLLQLDFIAYFVPLISMIITLVIINKTVPMSRIPGFEKLSGLFVIIMITFFVTYILQKMFFGVFFIGKFEYLIALFLGVLLILRIAWRKIVK